MLELGSLGALISQPAGQVHLHHCIFFDNNPSLDIWLSLRHHSWLHWDIFMLRELFAIACDGSRQGQQFSTHKPRFFCLLVRHAFHLERFMSTLTLFWIVLDRQRLRLSRLKLLQTCSFPASLFILLLLKLNMGVLVFFILRTTLFQSFPPLLKPSIEDQGVDQMRHITDDKEANRGEDDHFEHLNCLFWVRKHHQLLNERTYQHKKDFCCDLDGAFWLGDEHVLIVA